MCIQRSYQGYRKQAIENAIQAVAQHVEGRTCVVVAGPGSQQLQSVLGLTTRDAVSRARSLMVPSARGHNGCDPLHLDMGMFRSNGRG
jgi:hypothetical protein